MRDVERVREILSTAPTQEYFQVKMGEGWRPVAIEWERECRGDSRPSARLRHEVPFGLRVSDDCHYLEDNPAEKGALTLMMALITADHPLSKVASELNRQGFRTRGGSEWTLVAVFNMLPRLIEAAPEILSAEEWTEEKLRILRSV